MRKILIAVIALAMAGMVTALTLGPMSLEQFEDAQDDPVYWNELGYMLAQEGKTEQAQSAFTQAVALDPGYENARKNLYVAAFQNEDYVTAQEHLRVLLEENPTAQYHFDYAQSLVSWARSQATDGEEAVGALQEALLHLEAAGSYGNAEENAAIVRDVLGNA